ncbi:MAG: phospholipase D-like domain-containing protein, partial [Vicinamibacterales bacterium]
MTHLRLSFCASISICLLLLAGAGSAAAQTLAPQERLCDPAFEDCREDVLRYIQQETVAIDMGFWMMTDARYSNELVKAWQRGVKIRLLMDPRCAEAHAPCVTQNNQLRDAGIPMRNRITGGILHWKMALFASQGQLQFAGANYSPFEFAPEIPYVNYTDELVAFTNDPALVHSFMTKFDDLWTSPSEFGNFANITAPLVRSYPTYPIDPELNFPPEDSYRARAIAAYNAENQQIDVQMFRITDGQHPDAMIAAVNRGVPVRLITDETEYRNPTRLWDSYHVDRMFVAGVQVKLNGHQGIDHEKAISLWSTGLSIFGSSNWTDASSDSQREHNYFTVKPWIETWLKAQFKRKWNNETGFSETKPFVPLPPNSPAYRAPAVAATDIAASGVVLSWDAGFWAHNYDIYFGTAPNPPLLESNKPLGPSQYTGDYRTYALPDLQPGTTYYWKIVSKTMALAAAEGPIWRFTTAGSAPPPPPPPPPTTITLVRGPYLQQPTDRSIVIVWATREPGSAEVRYVTPSGTLVTPAVSRLVSNATTAIGYDYYQYEASLNGLAAATTYSYQPFVSGVGVSAPATFRTAPVRGSGAVSFIAFGDSGTGSPEQRQLAALMAGDSFDFAMHVGDIAYGGSNGSGDATYATYQSFLFDVYPWLASVPFVPVEGNHDSRASNADGSAYLDLFSLPRNGASSGRPDHAERYYSFDYGPVHFVALDTEFAFQDPARLPDQLAWLETDLAATTQPWTIAFYHRAPYSSGGEHGSDVAVRDTFGPLLEKYGVDLVLTGHEHDYERTVPIRVGPSDTNQAVPYVVTGGGGAPLYPAATSAWTAYSASRHEYVKVTVDACNLTLSAIGLDGAAFDGTSISHCTTPPPAPDALPSGWSHVDVGSTGVPGSATHDAGTFTLKGAGADVWGGADALHYAYRTLAGDGSIVARVGSVQNVAPWTKAGVMIRNTLSPSSAQAFMLVSPGKGIAFQRRLADGNASVSTSGAFSTAPRWVKLTRTGTTITAFESTNGSTWTLVGSDTFAMGASVQIGLGISSHVSGTLATAVFDNVSVTVTAAPPSNVAPSVTLASPISGGTAPATIALSATASDSDGTIAKVDFFAGAVLVGSATAAPYTVSWTTVPAGTYSISAVATDNGGASTTSASVSVTVTAAPPGGPALPAGWTNADVGLTGAAGST